jgi:hypothetical protein
MSVGLITSAAATISLYPKPPGYPLLKPGRTLRHQAIPNQVEGARGLISPVIGGDGLIVKDS